MVNVLTCMHTQLANFVVAPHAFTGPARHLLLSGCHNQLAQLPVWDAFVLAVLVQQVLALNT